MNMNSAPRMPGAQIEKLPEFKIGDRVERDALKVYGEEFLRGTITDIKQFEDQSWGYKVEWDGEGKKHPHAGEGDTSSIGHVIDGELYYTLAGIRGARTEFSPL